jgi:hypothetical protein
MKHRVNRIYKQKNTLENINTTYNTSLNITLHKSLKTNILLCTKHNNRPLRLNYHIKQNAMKRSTHGFVFHHHGSPMTLKHRGGLLKTHNLKDYTNHQQRVLATEIVRSASNLFYVAILRALFFDPEDEGIIFLRNVGWLSTDNTALYPRRQLSS